MTYSLLDAAGRAAIAGTGIALRREIAADRDFTRALYATQRARELALVPWDQAAKSAFVDHQFAAQRAHFDTYMADADYLIVVRGLVAIGRLYLHCTVDPWQLAEVALVPEETGRGTGAALVGWVIDKARAGGASGVDLYVATDNERAAAFYRRMGFGEVASDFATHHRMLFSFTTSQVKIAS